MAIQASSASRPHILKQIATLSLLAESCDNVTGVAGRHGRGQWLGGFSVQPLQAREAVDGRSPDPHFCQRARGLLSKAHQVEAFQRDFLHAILVNGVLLSPRDYLEDKSKQGRYMLAVL